MAPGTVNFDAPDLAAQIEQLSRYELDHLPFGVILLNGEGVVLFYSATEAQQSGYGKIPIGQNLFEISSCMASDDFRGRIMRAMEEGPVDLEFGWKQGRPRSLDEYRTRFPTLFQDREAVADRRQLDRLDRHRLPPLAGGRGRRRRR